jgi:hypothetical protein
LPVLASGIHAAARTRQHETKIDGYSVGLSQK